MKLMKPTEADYDELTAVWEASVRATHHFLSEAAIQFFKPLVRNEFLKAVQLYSIRNETGIVAFLGVQDGKIEMLFIHPNTMGRGLGKKLLLFAVHELGATQVGVNEQNTQAVEFYKHIGFKQISRSPVDGMGKPFPMLLMEWAGAYDR